jgi:hypothetical protein
MVNLYYNVVKSDRNALFKLGKSYIFTIDKEISYVFQMKILCIPNISFRHFFCMNNM